MIETQYARLPSSAVALPQQPPSDNSPGSITVVLRPSEGTSTRELMDALRWGAVISIPGAGIATGISEGDALARTELLDAPDSPLHKAVALLEHVVDTCGSSTGSSLAAGCALVANEMRVALNIPKPHTAGLDDIACDNPGSPPDERGRDLLVAIERLARRVIERELTLGGLIHRAIQGGAK